jgi:adenylate cyclase
MGLFFSYFLCLLLALRFVLSIFAPGTEETQPIFTVFGPVLPLLHGLTNLLVLPLAVLWKLVLPMFPPGTELVFPETKAAGFVEGGYQAILLLMPYLQDTPVGEFFAHVNPSERYPGKMEWLVLLSIPFWMGAFHLLQTLISILWGTVQHLAASQLQAIEAKQSAMAAQQLRTIQMAQPALYDKPRATQGNAEVQDTHVRKVLQQLRQENRILALQKQELRSTFSHYFAPTVLSYLEANPEVLQRSMNQTHWVTVLFCDIRNFTKFSESHTSEEINQYLADFFDIVNHVILTVYNGTINKLIGDSVMAFWNFPMPVENHAELATLAAVSILEAIDRRNQQPGVFPLKVGIGLSTGEVSIGNIGSREFKDFTVIGPAVNLASRLQEATKQFPTCLLLDEATYVALQHNIACADVGDVALRGLEGHHRLYYPLITGRS